MRLLVLSAPFGAGHHLAGVAVQAALRHLSPDSQCTVSGLDQVGPMRLAGRGYLWSLRHLPGLWRRLYAHTGTPRGRSAMEGLIARTLRGELRAALAGQRPDAVVCTHPFPAMTLGQMRQSGELTGPLVCVVTDFLPHRSWVHPGVDHYFVAPIAARQRLMELGVPAARITESGIPIAPAFAHESAPWPETGRALRLLVMGGSLGLGPLPHLARQLADLPVPVQVEVVAGHNAAMHQALLQLRRRYGNLVVHGYSREVHRLMRRAHLLIGKPGGLTASEAMACGLPMLLVGALPGHEEENARVLEEAGAAVRSGPSAVAQDALRLLSGRHGPLGTMREAARAAGRPHAAETVTRWLLGRTT